MRWPSTLRYNLLFFNHQLSCTQHRGLKHALPWDAWFVGLFLSLHLSSLLSELVRWLPAQ